MKKNTLGSTGLKVTQLCFGTLTMSPMQRDLSPKDGGSLIMYGLRSGINFIDTAQMYGSYPHVKEALRSWGGERPVVSSKSAAKDRPTMKAAIDECLNETGLDYIDIFLLHAVRDVGDYDSRAEALKALQEAKQAGKIRFIGASSHSARTIDFLSHQKEIDILHPMFNKDGIGILDVELSEMKQILRFAKAAGKGIYAMKPLGGGHLRNSVQESLEWVFKSNCVDAAAVGMTTIEEVQMNVAICRGEKVDSDFAQRVAGQPRRLFINEGICINCGKCIAACQQKALVKGEKHPQIKHEQCVLCGYCAPECPKFAIRII